MHSIASLSPQVESGHRGSVRRGRGDYRASPGHSTMSLWHPQTDSTRFHTLHRPHRFSTRFVTDEANLVPDVISIDITGQVGNVHSGVGKKP